MLHFESNNFLDDRDESFVSIDLNDNEDECEICHQETEERTVRVILSHEFLKFEGSFERNGEKLTHAHQICLDRWSEIIERNLKFENDNKQSNVDKNTQSNKHTLGSRVAKEEELFSKKTDKVLTDSVYDAGGDVDLKNNISNQERTNTRCQLKQNMHSGSNLYKMGICELKDILSKLDIRVTEASSLLVDELQLRDHLNQEISAQKTLIEQLVKLQKNSPSLPRQPLQTPLSKTSIVV